MKVKNLSVIFELPNLKLLIDAIEIALTRTESPSTKNTNSRITQDKNNTSIKMPVLRRVLGVIASCSMPRIFLTAVFGSNLAKNWKKMCKSATRTLINVARSVSGYNGTIYIGQYGGELPANRWL